MIIIAKPVKRVPVTQWSHLWLNKVWSFDPQVFPARDSRSHMAYLCTKCNYMYHVSYIFLINWPMGVLDSQKKLWHLPLFWLWQVRCIYLSDTYYTIWPITSVSTDHIQLSNNVKAESGSSEVKEVSVKMTKVGNTLLHSNPDLLLHCCLSLLGSANRCINQVSNYITLFV